MMVPPKPLARPPRVPFWRHLRLFRRDILSAQPARLYHALMAEFRTPFFRSFLCNDPALVDLILRERPQDFPKSNRVAAGLAPVLGENSVFLTNGPDWARQRRIIDPAFDGGRLRDGFPAVLAAARGLQGRFAALAGGDCDVEALCSQAAADAIFRLLFSVPIEDRTALAVYGAFRDYQRSQPLLNAAAFMPLPGWLPRLHRRKARAAAAAIRSLVTAMTSARAAAIARGEAPDDLATRIMTTPDPETGARFGPAEMADQVAIFFLAGHETSAAALAWALYLLAADEAAQAQAAAEAARLPETPELSDLSGLAFIRDVVRETLRLYPPVPMMVRENRCPVDLRGRRVAAGAQLVVSPWHLHRHDRFWASPDAFDPGRWQTSEGRASARTAWLPFSTGPRICPGAGFAMAEITLMLAMVLRAVRLSPAGPPPVPVAYLTVRARDGIRLAVRPRGDGATRQAAPDRER